MTLMATIRSLFFGGFFLIFYGLRPRQRAITSHSFRRARASTIIDFSRVVVLPVLKKMLCFIRTPGRLIFLGMP